MMTMPILPVVTACCAGIASACLALYLLRALSGVELETAHPFAKSLPVLMRLLLPFVPVFRRLAEREFLTPMRENDHARLQMAGYAETIRAADFLSLKFLCAVVAGGVLLLGASGGQLIGSFLVAVLLLFYPALWLQSSIRKRHLAIMKALPNVLDLLTLSVESGRDLISALRDILNRRRMDPLGEELTRTFQEIQIGRKRTEALRALAQRVRQEDLTATVNAIIQAEEYGVSIAQLLRIQGDMQRNKRFALAEKMANESAVKIIIPVVVCILPAVFIILMGPIAVQTMRMFR